MSRIIRVFQSFLGTIRGGSTAPNTNFGRHLHLTGIVFDELRRAAEEVARAAKAPWPVRLVNDSVSGTIFVNHVAVIRIGPGADGRPTLGVAEEIHRPFQPLVQKIVAAFLRLEAAAAEGARFQAEGGRQGQPEYAAVLDMA